MPSDGHKYLFIVLRYLWVIVIAAAIAGGLTYAYRANEPRTYTTDTHLYVGDTLFSAAPQKAAIEASELIARVYAQFVKFPVILEPVYEEFEIADNYGLTYQEFAGLVSAEVIGETPLLVIRVTLTDQDGVAGVANAVAASLMMNRPLESDESTGEQTYSSIDEIDELLRTLVTTRTQLVEVEDAIDDTLAEDRLEILTAQRDELIFEIDNLTTEILALQTSELSMTNSLYHTKPAQRPVSANGINPIIMAIAGAVVGGMFSTAVILFFAYIDNRIRNEDDVQHAVSIPLLGVVKHTRKNVDFTTASIPEVITENFRNILANLVFTPTPNEQQSSQAVYLISSSKQREGRTFVAANLAIVAAESGLNVLLIDAGLRSPKLSELFELRDKRGLVDLLQLLRSDTKLREYANESALLDVVKQHMTRVANYENLSIMSCGKVTDNLPPGIMAYGNIETVMQILHDHTDFDIIIIDTSPASIADTPILATKVKGSALLIVDAGRTTDHALRKLYEQFKRLGTRVDGVILNNT